MCQIPDSEENLCEGRKDGVDHEVGIFQGLLGGSMAEVTHEVMSSLTKTSGDRAISPWFASVMDNATVTDYSISVKIWLLVNKMLLCNRQG